MTVALFILDLVLALGACLRLTRFIVADDVPGTWWIKSPLDTYKHWWKRRHSEERKTFGGTYMYQPFPWWEKYLDGLSCPHCIGVWMAAAVTASLYLAGGPGHAADWYRWPAGFLTLAWLTGHIAALAGDVEDVE